MSEQATGLGERLDAAVKELRDAIEAAPPNHWAFCGSWTGKDGRERSIDLTVGQGHVANAFIPPPEKEASDDS